MGKPVAGDVVIVPFPQTDLKAGKLRPALVLVDLPGDDLILCQITSQVRFDGFSIPLDLFGFCPRQAAHRLLHSTQSPVHSGAVLVVRMAGRVKPAKLKDVLAAARKIFT